MATIFFVVGAKPFPVNQNIKCVCFHYAFQIFPILAVVYLTKHKVIQPFNTNAVNILNTFNKFFGSEIPHNVVKIISSSGVFGTTLTSNTRTLLDCQSEYWSLGDLRAVTSAHSLGNISLSLAPWYLTRLCSAARWHHKNLSLQSLSGSCVTRLKWGARITVPSPNECGVYPI